MATTTKQITLTLLYRCAGNYKTSFDHVVDTEQYPDAVNLKVDDEIQMGKYGTLPKKDFFGSEIHPYSYNKRLDHNLLNVEAIDGVGEEDLLKIELRPETNSPQSLESYILETAAGKFLSGSGDYTAEYQKLVKAKAKGKGDQMAYSHAEVWEGAEDETVEKLLELIDSEIKSLREFADHVIKLESAKTLESQPN